MAVTIAHLSDLHLGNDIWWRALKEKRRWWNIEPSEEVKNGLIKSLNDLKPNYVIISGDFVNDPKPKNFERAAEFLRDVLIRSGINLEKNVLVVPGNHDASLYSSAESERLPEYQAFLKKLFGVDGRKARFIKIDHDLKAIFLCLDSTLKGKQPLAEGEIGLGQIDWATRNLMELQQSLGEEYKNYAKIAVLHHHCLQIKGQSTKDERFMQLLDEHKLTELLHAFGFNLVLHGHKHVPRVDEMITKGDSIIPVVGAGTAVCPILEEQHQMGNNFNFVRIDMETMDVVVQRLKADGEGTFRLDHSRPVPLFFSRSGYTVKEMTKAVTILPDGTTRTICSKIGLRSTEVVLRSLPLTVSTTANGAKIKDIHSAHPDAELVITNTSDNIIEAKLLLREPLVPGKQVTVAWEHTISGDAALTFKDLQRLYGPDTGYDRTGVNVLP